MMVAQQLKMAQMGGVPGRPMVSSVPTCTGHTLDPFPGTISHVLEQLSRCITTTEVHKLQSVLHKRSHRNERPAQRNKE